MTAPRAQITKRYELFIGGDWRPADTGSEYGTVNPYSGQTWATVPNAGESDVDLAVGAAREALDGAWGRLTGFARAALMRKLADLLDRDGDELARLESTDNGKPYRETRGQVTGLGVWLRYFAGVADKLQGEVIDTDKSNYMVYTRPEPLGVVAAIAAWNSPLLLMMWKVAPVLAAGCTVVIKPSEHTPVTALEFARRVEEAGFPAGTVNVITGNTIDVGKALVAHPGVDHVCFTGSPGVGREIARSAASHFATSTLELGGKSGQIVFDDASVEEVVNGLLAGIYAASGQTCVAGSRLIVQAGIRDRVLEALAARAATIVLGDPLDPATQMGPMATEQQFATVAGFVDRARADGAEIVLGGGNDAAAGPLFFQPTIVSGVGVDMELAQEEVFGPVLAVLTFESEEEAVQMANSTKYSLACGVWTNDLRRAHRVAAAVRAGNVWVNCYRMTSPAVPFGGSGASGWGRESGVDAVRHFTSPKAVWLELEGQTRDPFTLG